MLKRALLLLLIGLGGLSACTVRERSTTEETTWGIPTHVNEHVTTYSVGR